MTFKIKLQKTDEVKANKQIKASTALWLSGTFYESKKD
jgi:hypothetical protein